MGLVEAQEWNWWRPRNGTSGGLGMGLVEAQEWDWWRPRNGTGGDLGMGLMEAQEWDQWRPRNETGGGLGMGLVEAQEWDWWRPRNGTGGGLGMRLVETQEWDWWRPRTRIIKQLSSKTHGRFLHAILNDITKWAHRQTAAYTEIQYQLSYLTALLFWQHMTEEKFIPACPQHLGNQDLLRKKLM